MPCSCRWRSAPLRDYRARFDGEKQPSKRTEPRRLKGSKKRLHLTESVLGGSNDGDNILPETTRIDRIKSNPGLDIRIDGVHEPLDLRGLGGAMSADVDSTETDKSIEILKSLKFILSSGDKDSRSNGPRTNIHASDTSYLFTYASQDIRNKWIQTSVSSTPFF
jgi:hypothetical protein